MRCPRCGEDRHPDGFDNPRGWCGACYGLIAPTVRAISVQERREPGEGRDPVDELQGETARGRQEEAHMEEQPKKGYRECPWCHTLKSNIYGHAKVCKARPEGSLPLKPRDWAEYAAKHAATAPQEARPATKTDKPLPKAVRTPRVDRKALQASAARLVRELPDCAACPGNCLIGLNVPQIQLVERGVRLGLGLDQAVEFVKAAGAATLP